jgi:hypothetical protein
MLNIKHLRAAEADDITEPVTVTELRDFARIDSSDENRQLLSIIKAARQTVEKLLNYKVVPHTVSYSIASVTADEEIELPYGVPSNVVVNSVVRGVSTLQTVDESYYLSGEHLGFFYRGAYAVTYSVGTEPVKESVKEAILMLAAYRFSHRGDAEDQFGIPDDVMAIIEKERKICL